MKRTSADYAALKDGPITLTAGGGPETVVFNPANDIKQDGLVNRPVLNYRVDPSNGASNLRLRVQINGQNTGSGARLSGTTSRAYTEIIGSPLNTGANNVTFEIDESPGATGQLKISDVIMFYKRFN